MNLEACVETLKECLMAEKNGAHQLELCADLHQDGLTPSDSLISSVLQNVHIPVKIMVRPRGGDFCYDDSEIKEMEASILKWKNSGIQGVVLGVLNEDQTIDTEATRRLAELSFPLEVTFHKAIDQTPDILVALQKLKAIPEISHILTSGGASTAIEGGEILKRMLEISNGQPGIIPAGKITSQNLSELDKLLGAATYHGRRIVG